MCVPAGTPAAAGYRRWLPPNAFGPFNSPLSVDVPHEIALREDLIKTK